MNPHDMLRHHVTGAIERGEAEAYVELKALRCNGGWDCCDHAVTMIGDKGYVYCTPCGAYRNTSTVERVRKLGPGELRILQSGQPLARY
jgi:hypothetical protein